MADKRMVFVGVFGCCSYVDAKECLSVFLVGSTSKERIS